MVVGAVTKVAIIGANGQLGTELVKVFGELAIPLTHSEVDITKPEAFKILKEKKPAFVINAAAYVNVDKAEEEAGETFNVNAIGAYNVAKICNEIGACCIYISTDYVFDGKKGKPYSEGDCPNPLNIYGASKYLGEVLTKDYSSKYYIIRMSGLFGKAGARGKGGNFIESIIEKARNNEEIKVVDDIFTSFTYAKDAAASIKKIIELKPEYGVYNIVNSGYNNWYSFAKKIFEYLKISIDVKNIKAVESGRPAKRPVISALTNSKINKLGIKMPKWENALKRYLIEKEHIKR